MTASNLGEREQLALFATTTRGGGARSRRPMRVRRRYGDDAVTRARLLGAGLPAPFERDPRNPLDRRARGVPADGSRRGGADRDRDSQGVTDVDDIPPDDA